ncbi:glutamate mutase L [Candidatus Acetothermia bacterium]|nr:glutamate mutase L [Candidatus Acetothermia bacterium]MCI2426515.1 glutamate mutase L [Candidatus Acetothermia bacterium]MCI2427789.1 glutamate mutase L [Candidatus Acetothermia bacterium]MCI2428278.1 glutamate mutase L [Candidatus Acetothermia bacterium]
MMKKIDLLVAEIGSTITKVKGLSLQDEPTLLGTGEGLTTVLAGDVMLGLQRALNALATDLKLVHGNEVAPFSFDDNGNCQIAGIPLWASSSAAGGLKMTVHGLVYAMTVRAAREAALGAGAVLHLVTAGKIGAQDLKQIAEITPNIILLAGGVEGGERETAIYNARQLAAIDSKTPIIYCGNSAARGEISRIFNGTAHSLTIVDNVYPRLDELNIEPTRRAIQQVFERHIITAPGMDRIGELVSGKIIPTPGAVMEAAKLLAADIDDLVVIDIGGATTDVHSVTEGSAEIAEILIAPEPRAKRTVEGDLGLFVSAKSTVDSIGNEKLVAELKLAGKELPISPIPTTPIEERFTLRLAQEAIVVALRRHTGRIRELYGPTGRIMIAEGKDLSKVKWIIGTGGFFARNSNGKGLLIEMLANNKNKSELSPPSGAKVLIDHNYIMSTAGVIAQQYPTQAVTLLKESLGLA